MKKRILTQLTSALLVPLMMLAAGCNSSGGGSSDKQATKTVSGFVEDGPVEHAKVTLVPLSGQGATFGPVLTDASGAFSLTVPEKTDLSNYQLLSADGKDVTTGMNGLDLTGITFRAPLAMFSNGTSPAAVTPLTTLVTIQMTGGSSLDEATKQVRGTLKLPADADLSARPSQAEGLLHARAMMLSLTAQAHAKKSPGHTQPPFERITFTAQGTPEITAFPELQESFEVIEEAVSNDQSTTRAFARKRLQDTVIAILDENSDASKKEEPVFKANLKTLIGGIFTAAGTTQIALDSFAPERIIRNVLTTSEIATYDDFMGNPFNENTGWIKDSTDIPAIAAAVTAVYDVEEPLFSSELVGDDNQKRVNYYYNSNLSHLHKAETVVNKLRSDSISDFIMAEIAAGKANSGFIAEAENIIDTQIFQELNKVYGLLKLGEALSKQGNNEKAVTTLEKAEASLKRVIDARGEGQLAEIDADYLTKLANYYLAADAIEKADSVLTYLIGMSGFITDTSVYGRLVHATEDIGDIYRDNNQTEKAQDIGAMLLSLSNGTPANTDGLYSSKTYHLNVTARFAEALNNKNLAHEAFISYMNTCYDNYGQEGQSINETGNDIRDTESHDMLFMALYNTENHGDTEKLYAFFKDDAQQASLKELLAHLVTEQGMGTLHDPCPAALKDLSAEDILAYKLESSFFDVSGKDTQLTALTYYNKHNRYVAAILIDQNKYSDARKALVKAEEIADTIPHTDIKFYQTSRVEKGYYRIATLYTEMEAFEDARRVLEKSEESIPYYSDFTDPDPKVQAKKERNYNKLVQCIADGYIAIGDVEKALSVWGDKELTIDDYLTIIKPLMALGKAEEALDYTSQYLIAARDIFDNSSAPDTHAEEKNEDEVRHLLNVAEMYIAQGENAKAVTVILEAKDRADQLFTAETRDEFYADKKSIVNCTAGLLTMAGAEKEVMDFALAISLKDVRYEALDIIATLFTTKDDFKDKTTGKEAYYHVASVDTDKDGKPNFFNPTATNKDIAASGLVLDEDSDNDGKPDTTDTTPYHKD